MLTVKLIAVGDSLAFVLPPEVLAHLQLGAGDTLYLTETPDGFRLTAHAPGFPPSVAC